MSKSASLRGHDYRLILQLVGECRDLAADPIAWRLQLLERLCQCLGGRVGAGGEAVGVDQGQFIPTSLVECGWENDAQKRAMFEWLEHQAANGERTGLFPLPETSNGDIALSRGEALTDRQWYGSVQYNEYMTRSDLDDFVVSFQPIAGRQFSGLAVFRPVGDRKFTRRDLRFLEQLHRQLAPLVGTHLAAANEPSASELSPRLRQVLDCLLEGDGEKQVAARLGLTRQTVNQYVKSIYRHFRVTSRAELMARWIRYARGG